MTARLEGLKTAAAIVAVCGAALFASLVMTAPRPSATGSAAIPCVSVTPTALAGIAAPAALEAPGGNGILDLAEPCIDAARAIRVRDLPVILAAVAALGAIVVAGGRG